MKVSYNFIDFQKKIDNESKKIKFHSDRLQKEINKKSIFLYISYLTFYSIDDQMISNVSKIENSFSNNLSNLKTELNVTLK